MIPWEAILAVVAPVSVFLLVMQSMKTRRALIALQAIFDMRWDADMRAIKRWQTETGKVLTWPDHADLVVWLLGKLEKQDHPWV